eukprot:2838491-Rhodomonas_salina.1
MSIPLPQYAMPVQHIPYHMSVQDIPYHNTLCQYRTSHTTICYASTALISPRPKPKTISCHLPPQTLKHYPLKLGLWPVQAGQS